MPGPRHFQFFSNDRRDPYFQRIIDYQISDTEGYIHFDGYYYVLNEEFPIRTMYNVTLRADEPYEEGETADGGTYAKYKNVEDKWYEIEIYDRVKIEDTSRISEIDDEDGQPMRVCFFPTHEQKILFRVIKQFDSFEEFLGRATELFNEGKEVAPTTIVYESSNEVLVTEVESVKPQ
jgi:hypothetical protein